MLDVLQRAFRGSEIDFTVLVSDAVLARLHVVVQTPGADTPEVDEAVLESELAAIARGWPDELRDALVAARGEEAGVDAFRIWRDAFPPGYQADVTPEQAVADIAVLEDGRRSRHPAPERAADDGVAHLKLYRSGAPLLLSDVMPVLEHLDVIVVDERPYAITPAGGAPRWIYSFGVRAASGDALADPDAQARVSELFLGVWAGDIENDGLNRLVLHAGLTARQVVVLRSLVKYLHQAGMRFTEASFADALAANPGPARRIVDLFEARFDIALAEAERARAVEGIDRELGARDRRGGEPRRGSHPARARRSRPSRSAHELVPAAVRWRCPSSWIPRNCSVSSRAAAGTRDLGVLAACRSRAPARWRHRAWRDPVVRPARRLPHRDPRA